MLWSILFVVITALINAESLAIESKIKSNYFDPVLSASSYVGHMKENERIVQLEPSLFATDDDPSNSLNGEICGYELSLYKHDDITNETRQNIPFTVELVDGKPSIQLKKNVNKVDCEIKQTYRLFVRAYDCGNKNERRYSERSLLTISIDDVNEFAPVFTHKSYFFKLHQDQNCLSCRVEATDDDCSNVDHRVCDYQITTPDVPFSIDSNGLISIKSSLTNNLYEFDVVAIDCYSSSSSDNKAKMISEPAKVMIKIIKSCKPTIKDSNPSKVTIQSDHTHIFETIHVDVCEETCAVEDIAGQVILDSNGIDSGCNLEQCLYTDRKYTLVQKDADVNQPPQINFASFDGLTQSSIIPKVDFSGEFKNDFTVRMWMKRDDEESTGKEHIFCKSDEKLKNRHHTALLIQDGYLKLLIRKGPLSTNDKHVYSSEWMWKLPHIKDNQWHSYKLFVNYPTNIDLYIDDQLFVTTDDNFKIIEDFALPVIEGTGDTIFAVGACWHARASRMAQHFRGQLSALTIEQKEDLPKSQSCTQDCLQYLDLPDLHAQSGIKYVSNSNRSIWNLRSDSSESFEELLKHVVYRNTFEPMGPPGQRTVSVSTTLKCLGENYTYSLPTFTRRLSIDEIISPSTVELHGETSYVVSEHEVNQYIHIFRNLTISSDAIKKEQAELTDCSINTSPDLTNDEQLTVPDDILDMDNIQKEVTQSGLILSGLASIEIYQNILRSITYISKPPVTFFDRTFSLVCVGTRDQMTTNELHIPIHIQKEVAPPALAASILSNKLYVNNDHIRDTIFDIAENSQPMKNISGWPIVVVICVSVGLASILVLYLVVRIRTGNKQRNPLAAANDDVHSQMEWEDDIGLNIIVNPLEQTKKPVQIMNDETMKQTIHKYDGATSEEDEYDEQSYNEYSSDEDDEDYDDDNEYETNQIHAKKNDHQLEWDDEAMEYGPKKV